MKINHFVYGRTTTYNLNYYIVWSVKYRRKVLTPEVKAYMRGVIQDTADSKGFQVDEFNVLDMNCVSLAVTAPPKLSPSLIIQYLKGITGSKILERYPELRDQLWKGELWNHSTYVETVGDISKDVLQNYMEHQSKQY